MKPLILSLFRKIIKLPFIHFLFMKMVIDKRLDNFFVKLLPQLRDFKFDEFYYSITQSGIKLKLYPNQFLDYIVFYKLKEEDKNPLYNLINKKNLTILDIGTNNAETILQMANLNREGFLFGFEPNLVMFNRAKENICLNNFTNISIENIGLGKENNTSFLNLPKNNMGGAYKTIENTGIEFTIEKLDDWVIRKNIEDINLIKIDIEGFEPDVIIGGYNTIKKFHPVLFVEVNENHLKRAGYSIAALFQILLDLNYSIYDAHTKDLYNSMNYPKQHTDIICYYNSLQ